MTSLITPTQLPQLNASAFVDIPRLERKVKAMYRRVARQDAASLHFDIGRPLAERLGYPRDLLDRIPAAALASFAGVGYHLDMATFWPGHSVLDLGSGSGADAFVSAHMVGAAGRVVGIDMTKEQVAKARELRNHHGYRTVEFVEGRIEALPFPDASFDAVVTNGVVNLAPDKSRAFAEAARVLRPGGRLAIADIVSGRPLKEHTRRNVDLWAACVAGAVTGDSYIDAMEAAGLEITDLRHNDYRFRSLRAQETVERYDVVSLSIAAVKPA